MSTPTTRATPTPSAVLTRVLPRDGETFRPGILTGLRRFGTRRDHVGLSAPDDF